MIKVEIDSETIRVKLMQIDEKIQSNIKTALNEVADYGVADVRENVISKKQFDGKKLADNKPATIKRKGRNSPLIDTGAMLSGLKKFKINDFEYYIGFTEKRDIYGKYLHAGTPKMEGRPVIGVSRKLKNFALNKLNQITKQV